ncbi:RagB/SusD family nutrient uptake outer membrane protein [Aliifodinibius sp. S!AR15-10]|uniref:RagB/SusD family nutrient uptake outer membrane protein n=1 Tax=Aliifodinibius sp. S!AR15-10 TaxID=2950437 RepID=UPI00285C598C|nr:RagB/SusD family nutrient uptake outer membrane protein [Aliifodinibius sp. S!AR15-10]MDR8392513.1 RagB/SusD family nutrient uptake outer membrane protein [Aliifodinibius sp. S!AR15-10]
MKKLIYLLTIGLILLGCTDLTDVDEDGISRDVVEGGGSGIDNPAAALTGAYSQLNELTGAGETFALMEHSSDEMMGPTRGTDWSDFGVWRQLHAHIWDPAHSEVLEAWNDLNAGIFRATQVVDAQGATARQISEARFLRAFFMFYVMDLYGQVPFRPSDAGPDDIPQVFSRTDAFDFIIEDLTNSRPNLPTLTSGADAGIASQEAADFLLAKLYLNRAVYTSSTAENPSAGPYTFEDVDMDEVITRVQNIIDNPYTDLTSFYHNFHWDNSTLSNELIFVIDNQAGAPTAVVDPFVWTLHYNQTPRACCNGFTTISDFYGRFTDDSDIRKSAYIPDMSATTGILGGFLVGQQYGSYNAPDSPENPLTDRGGNPLIFTEEVDLLYSNERMGIRVIKYLVNPNDYNNPGTDFIFFRYADALLMKAEAHFRKGETGEALNIINTIRENREATPLQSLSEEAILNERGFEMYWEGWRRNDQVRFGQFTEAWDQKEASDPYRVLFPIPQRALDTNPNLIQNAGY